MPMKNLATALLAAWLPFVDAPHDGRQVWAYCVGSEHGIPVAWQGVVQWMDYSWLSKSFRPENAWAGMPSDIYGCTHWMPLPAAPQSE